MQWNGETFEYVEVVNWAKFQHYKDRNPPWIKLYHQLLRDYGYARLQDASKLHLFCLYLVSATTDNRIPADEAWLTMQCHTTAVVSLKPLLDAGFLQPYTDGHGQPRDARTPLAG